MTCSSQTAWLSTVPAVPASLPQSWWRETGWAIQRGDVSRLEATRTIDAAGYVVCPGFVDLHSHAGLTILGEPHHDPKVRQGVTTELVGIDGISHAPFKTGKSWSVTSGWIPA